MPDTSPDTSPDNSPATSSGSAKPPRDAVGFWFFGLGLLGLVRSLMRATRGGGFDADAITLLWLIGSVLLTAMGAVRIWRSRRQGRPPRA